MSLFKRIDHVEIVTNDLEKAVEFYGALGTLVRRTAHHGGAAEFLIGGTIFEVHEVGTGGRGEENPGVNHISFLVEGGREALEEARGRLVEKGIACTEAHLVEETGRHIFNFRNSDGYRLQANATPEPPKGPRGKK